MQIKNLNKRTNFDLNSRLSKKYVQFQNLIDELRNRNLNDDIISIINDNVDLINSSLDSDNKFAKRLKNAQSKILKSIEKQHKLVTKNYYRNIWFALGIGAFGVPIGVTVGVITGNMAFIGIGIPIGFGIGLSIGTMMDQKIKEKGKQLDLEIKY
jgi:zinc transporter ZupT